MHEKAPSNSMNYKDYELSAFNLRYLNGDVLMNLKVFEGM